MGQQWLENRSYNRRRHGSTVDGKPLKTINSQFLKEIFDDVIDK